MVREANVDSSGWSRLVYWTGRATELVRQVDRETCQQEDPEEPQQ
jgi:hypothetical protein